MTTDAVAHMTVLTEMSLPDPSGSNPNGAAPTGSGQVSDTGADQVSDVIEIPGGGTYAIVGDEEQAPNASEADTQALAEAHFTCASPISSDEEVREALEILVSSVETGHSLSNQIDSAVYAAFERDVIDTPEMAARIAKLEGLEIIPASLRVSGLELLVELGCHSDVYVAKAARDTLRKGPIDRSLAPMWETAAELLPLSGDTAEPTEILATLDLIYG